MVMFMKKMLIFIFCCFLIIGCSSQKNLQQEQFDLYNDIKQQLISLKTNDQEYDFSIRVIFSKLDEEYRYDVVIDEPKVNMYQIRAMCYASENDQQMCPTIGLFDEEVFHLKKDYIDKTKGFYKGVQLSGTSDQIIPVRVYVSYYLDEKLTQKVEKYIEVENEIR